MEGLIKTSGTVYSQLIGLTGVNRSEYISNLGSESHPNSHQDNCLQTFELGRVCSIS